jgi:restriction system protein
MARRRRKKQGGVGGAVFGLFFMLLIASSGSADSIGGAVIILFLLFCAIIVFLLFLRYKKYQWLKKSGIQEIDKMDGRTFENYLGMLFKSLGYKVNVTQYSGDYGADLVIEKDGRKIVIQAKRYKGNVGIAAVQQIQAAVAHYKANEAWVVTNSYYTEAARRLAQSNNVRLIGRKELINMSLQMNEQNNNKVKKA